MLVLARRAGEAVLVGPNIKVVLLSSKNGTAKLGFEAPDNIEIWRDELAARIGWQRLLERNSQNLMQTR